MLRISCAPEPQSVKRKIAIRTSMGATRIRLVGRLLVESFIMATASCVAGYILTYWGMKGVAASIPKDAIPPKVAVVLRLASWFSPMGVAAVTTLLCGLAPAIHAVRRDLRTALAGTGKGTNETSRHGRLRSALVIAEVAVSIVLLTAAGLMVRSLQALQQVDLGFNPADILYAELALPEGRYDTASQKKVLFRKIFDRINAIPGVTAATVATYPPPYSWGWTQIEVLGKTHFEPLGTTFVMCTEGYFETLGRHLLSGRLLSQGDIDSARHVTVINETLARSYFRNENAVGQRIKLSTFEMYADWPRDAYFEIIGIIADAKNHGLQDPPRPEVYFPHTLTGTGPRMLMVRTAGNPDPVQASLHRELSALDRKSVV